MADHKGKTSNQLFSVLEEWERNPKRYFKETSASVSLPEPLPKPTPDM